MEVFLNLLQQLTELYGGQGIIQGLWTEQDLVQDSRTFSQLALRDLGESLILGNVSVENPDSPWTTDIGGWRERGIGFQRGLGFGEGFGPFSPTIE